MQLYFTENLRINFEISNSFTKGGGLVFFRKKFNRIYLAIIESSLKSENNLNFLRNFAFPSEVERLNKRDLGLNFCARISTLSR